MCKIGQRVEWFGAYWEAPALPAPIQYYYVKAHNWQTDADLAQTLGRCLAGFTVRPRLVP